MKLYIIDSLNKYFYTEDDLLKFLALEKTRIYSNKSSSIKVKTVNFEIESEISGNDYLSSSIVKTRLDTRIKAAHGDEYAEKVEKFISEFDRIAKDGGSKSRILAHLKVTNPDKKEFSKVVKKYSEYFLYNVSNSVEWYRIVLDVFGFKKLDDICRTEVINPVTKGWRLIGHRTPEKMIENFEKAKKIK